MPDSSDCVFCRVAADDIPGTVVSETEHTIAFLDHRPIFPGHTLVIPREHIETLRDLPADLIQPYFSEVKRLAAAVQDGMDAKGTFVAENNVVSQSVPHLHVHIIPRRPKDGLRGFFWPRGKYANDAEMEAAGDAIRAALAAG